MRKVRFDPDKLEDPVQKAWWTAWQKKSDDARDEILKAWEKWIATKRKKPFDPTFKEDVWKELKKWLLKHVFNERCAYCEAPLEFDRYKGDAEHFRPKGSVVWRDLVTNERKTARCKLADDTEIDHPGYFWLAYDWRNLMPACSACNSGGDMEEGKVDQFPVKAGHLLQLKRTALAAGYLPSARESPKGSGRYFAGPAAMDQLEQPFLLNPLNSSEIGDPAKHLRYGVGGCVVALDESPFGEHSIKVYRLGRGNIQARRQKAQEIARREYYEKVNRAKGDIRDPELSEMLSRYRAGKEDFSSAALQHLQDEVAFQNKLFSAEEVAASD